MSSDPSNDLATFDSLWDDLGDDSGEAPIPAALAVKPPMPPVPAEKRDTLLPPVPPPEYVQTMMELADLDDPSDPALAARPRPAPPAPAARPVPRPQRAVPRPDPPSSSLRLVASENELLLPTGDFAPGAATGVPRPAASAARAGARGSGDVSAAVGGVPVLPGMPIPRAPSIPPSQDPGGAGDPRQERDDDRPIVRMDEIDEIDVLAFYGASATARAPSDLHTPRAPSDSSMAPAVTGARTVPWRVPEADGPEPRPPTPPEPPRKPTTGGLRFHRPSQEVERVTPQHELERVTPLQEVERVTPLQEVGRVATADSEPPPVSVSTPDNLREMEARFAAKKYGDALVLAESVLATSPGHATARQCAESCRELLGEKYLSSLGGKRSVPRVAVPPDEIQRLSLDHRAGFLLSFIDGSMSVEEVLDVSSMPELDVLRIMFELRQQGVIELDEPPRRPGRK